MLNSFLLAIRFLILVFSGHKQVALENLALRQQLAVFTREKKRPRLHNRDRVFWIALRNLWKDWRTALAFVQPETATGWQRERFKRYCFNVTEHPTAAWAAQQMIEAFPEDRSPRFMVRNRDGIYGE